MEHGKHLEVEDAQLHMRMGHSMFAVAEGGVIQYHKREVVSPRFVCSIVPELINHNPSKNFFIRPHDHIKCLQ